MLPLAESEANNILKDVNVVQVKQFQCTNYEIGVFAHNGSEYVLAKVSNKVIGAVCVERSLLTHYCRFLEDGVLKQSFENLTVTRQVRYSGTCVSIDVLLLQTGGVVVRIIRGSNSLSFFQI